MPENKNTYLLRHIPAVDEVLNQSEVISLLGFTPRNVILQAIREAVAEIRDSIISEQIVLPLNNEPRNVLIKLVVEHVILKAQRKNKPNLRKVINLTGVILHTNLGRAVLADKAIKAIVNAASGYSNLELDLTTGKRGSRYAPVIELLTTLTGAESALVVNNNAAAVLLALSTLAKG